MERLAIKMMEVLLKKEMEYELHDTEMELEYEIPENDMGIPEVKGKVTMKIGNLVVKIDNSEY